MPGAHYNWPMHPRFFAPDLSPDCPVAALPRAEAEHLLRVLRIGVGERIAVFDGRGREYLASVEAAGPREVSVRLLAPLASASEPSVSLTLAPAVLKGDKMDEVIRDSVMLGVSIVQPVVSSRTEVTLNSLVRGQRVQRWNRIVIASVKQSGGAVVPPVRPVVSYRDYVEREDAELRLILVEPGARTDGLTTAEQLGAHPAPVRASLLVGPEGGWTGEEVDLAQRRGFVPLTLGRRTLRADRAPLTAIAVLQFLWKDL
jgi:16S rRNA (uracil1498-N3)-methyltransferase